MHKKRVWSNVIIASMLIFLVALALPMDLLVTTAKTEGVYYNGDKSQANVSLLFNVYSGGEYIEPILHALEKENVNATFFLGGCWASENADLVRKIHDAGMEIGNHGHLHKDHAKITASRQSQEIKTCHETIKGILDIDMTLFAPPSGSYNRDTVDIAKSLGYETIMWTLDTIDWRDKNADLVYKRATKTLANGNLILMHPTAHTLQALPSIIATYKRANFALVTVSSNIMPVI